MSRQNPSPQLVAACLLEGCKPVPLDAVVVGRCEGCGNEYIEDHWEDETGCWFPINPPRFYCKRGHRPSCVGFGCTDWKPLETVGEEKP